MAFPEGNKLFAGDLRASLDEKKRWYGSIYKEMELDCMDCIISRKISESLQLQMPVLHQSMYIFKASLSYLYDCWAKHKEKVPNVSDPNQNVETTYNSKLKFT